MGSMKLMIAAKDRKTTLAKKVYNHADVRTRFNCRAWVCISSSYNHKETLRAIIKQLNPITNQLLEMLERMQEQDLEQKLHQDLHDKRYLVVLDDIWKEEGWDCLARAFPDVNTSSRLLLTSRNRDVAKHADALSHPHELETLGQEDSWQLFLNKALGHGANVGCPLDFHEVGQKIARRCAGPPLAITVIGALLLGKKKLESEWEKVLNNINTYLSRSKSRVSAILELKGVMQKRDAENLEETAAYYVEQLFSRNMVQVAETAVDQRIKSCHDLLREFAISKAKEENFFQIHEIRDGEILAESSLSFETFGKLRIVDLENVRINSVPEEIGEVRFLRDQEDLRDMQVEKAALPQLQCLRIRNCRSLRVLPKELKHISTLDKLELVDMSKDFVSRLDAGLVSNVPYLKIF
ncbi:putative disease resistance RPP13-like protein 3 [Coffea eugenioides]|uniref:putative disease resistance RPP13-like protein 3 n=1 Tax=Coffea eugenioides TaxID=49369 RepID=UPI000F60957C|nr:putative disease resistance RPP13-like protein 3 [Coffea eugenioides]